MAGYDGDGRQGSEAKLMRLNGWSLRGGARWTEGGPTSGTARSGGRFVAAPVAPVAVPVGVSFRAGGVSSVLCRRGREPLQWTSVALSVMEGQTGGTARGGDPDRGNKENQKAG